VLPDADPPAPITRDHADDYVVAPARDAGAAALVSGDRDPLEAGLDEPPVWTPRTCANWLAETS
jgi:hypothetical protein